MGGLVGETFWDWLHVDLLWVAEELRGRGYGSRLLAAAEAEAVRRGCGHAYLETLGFQAPDFYRARGYRVFGELADFPPGHTRYFMRKSLRADGGGAPLGKRAPKTRRGRGLRDAPPRPEAHAARAARPE